MLEQYHKKVSPKNTNLPTDAALRLWRPGQPIPRDYAPNPHEALERHAAADERELERRRFNDRRQPRPADRKVAA